jgi:hypothetical protein
MNHAEHEPGTMDECPECRALTLEPGWYKALREERVVGARPDQVVVPEADEPVVEVVVAEVPSRPDLEVLDLEAAERDE